MKASQFTDAQKAFILKQGEEGVPVPEICRKAGISQATYFNWKRKYDGLLSPVPCAHCGHHVYPCAGTIFQDTRAPLQSWVYAIYLIIATRHGVSGKEMQRRLGVTYIKQRGVSTAEALIATG